MVFVCPVMIDCVVIDMACAVISENVTLSCILTTNDTHTVPSKRFAGWSSDQTEITQNLKINGKFSGKYSVSYDDEHYKLTVVNLTINDAGMYYCDIFYNQTYRRDTFEIKVIGKV